jgi:hypothetical protein
MSQTKMIDMEIPMDQYKFERMKYALEKAGKDPMGSLQKILHQKVVPTLCGSGNACKKQGA